LGNGEVWLSNFVYKEAVSFEKRFLLPGQEKDVGNYSSAYCTSINCSLSCSWNLLGVLPPEIVVFLCCFQLSKLVFVKAKMWGSGGSRFGDLRVPFSVASCWEIHWKSVPPSNCCFPFWNFVFTVPTILGIHAFSVLGAS